MSEHRSDEEIAAGLGVADAETVPVVVPWDAISPDALRGVIEAFVLREGTDYGTHEFTLDEKVAHVLRQLERGEAHVVWEPTTESVAIVLERAARGL
jgi:uncharacterized protein YheU (UPF0270 family)